MKRWNGLLEEYKSFLPVDENTPMLTLNEGGTPLVYLSHISKLIECDVYAKLEGLNPTGSFKDRGMVMAVAKAKEKGSEVVICASTGNTSASAAAYAARSGLKTIVVIPEGKIAAGKMAQAIAYGAEIVQIKGNFDDALNIVKEIAASHDKIALVNSVNPYRIEGQKTGAFEIIEQLESYPDVLAIPVGNAGNITAYWKGFNEYQKVRSGKLPKMFGFQAEGASPIVQNKVIENPETIATAIRIGNPASWQFANEAIHQSNGLIDSVTDEEILSAYRLMTHHEGLFFEPASNASIAGLLKVHDSGKLQKGQTIVAILTGNGLKDPDTAISANAFETTVLENDKTDIISFIESRLV